jgi:hypothetical protein
MIQDLTPVLYLFIKKFTFLKNRHFGGFFLFEIYEIRADEMSTFDLKY